MKSSALAATLLVVSLAAARPLTVSQVLTQVTKNVVAAIGPPVSAARFHRGTRPPASTTIGTS
jgi:hypothetical protein